MRRFSYLLFLLLLVAAIDGFAQGVIKTEYMPASSFKTRGPAAAGPRVCALCLCRVFRAAVQNGHVIPKRALSIHLHCLRHLQPFAGKALEQRKFQRRSEHAGAAALPHAAAAGVHGGGEFLRGAQIAERHLAHCLKGKARFAAALRQVVRGKLYIFPLLGEQKQMR